MTVKKAKFCSGGKAIAGFFQHMMTTGILRFYPHIEGDVLYIEDTSWDRRGTTGYVRRDGTQKTSNGSPSSLACWSSDHHPISLSGQSFDSVLAELKEQKIKISKVKNNPNYGLRRGRGRVPDNKGNILQRLKAFKRKKIIDSVMLASPQIQGGVTTPLFFYHGRDRWTSKRPRWGSVMTVVFDGVTYYAPSRFPLLDRLDRLESNRSGVSRYPDHEYARRSV